MPETTMPDISEDLVARLVAAQLPALGGLPVRAVPRQGNDNRSFRLGDDLIVRLPTAAGYADAVAVEHRWLPTLAPHVPVPIPEPVALGEPGEGFPWPWAVRRWVPGTALEDAEGVDRGGRGGIDLERLALDVGAFLTALRAVPAGGGPPASARSAHRGEHPSVYAAEVHGAVAALGGAIDADAALAIWRDATASAWLGPVWFHGDLAAGNLLVDAGGRLSGVIDFGCFGVGDPACDLVLAWTALDASARRVLRASAGLDDDAWRRARGWALWKSLVTLADPDASQRTTHERHLEAVLGDAVIA